MKIELSKREKKYIGIAGIITISLPFIITRTWFGEFDASTGVVGDTIGGITSPFLGFFGSILVFLALKAQIDANNEIKTQFNLQQIGQSNDFTFANYKERIHLIIKEINSFCISFHENRLIANLSDIPSVNGKKYNFTGIQAINLYLIEYFRQKKRI